MKTKAFLLSACIGGFALVAFACSSTTGVTSSNDAGPNTDKTPNGGRDSGTTNPITDSGPTPSGDACEASCTQEAKANCEGSMTVADCATECKDMRGKIPANCQSAYDAFVGCSATATFTCEDGSATTSNCEAEGNALMQCVSEGADPDGGAPDGGGGSSCIAPSYVGTPTDISKEIAWKPPTPQKGACKPGDVTKIVKNASTAKTPSELISGVGKQCGDCALTPSTSANWGPIIDLGNNKTLFNYGACAATVSGNATCGKMYEYLRLCFRHACNSCTDNASFTACAAEAKSGPQCNQVLKAVNNNCTDLDALDTACGGISGALTTTCVNGQ